MPNWQSGRSCVLTLTDAVGRTIEQVDLMNKFSTSGQFSLNISVEYAGVYFLQIQQGQTTVFTEKFIVHD